MIELKSIHLTRRKQPLLADFCLSFSDPGLYLLTGPSGSGKSLISRMLAGQVKPQSGKVLIDGDPLYHWIKGYRGMVFHACAERLPQWPEPLVDYVQTELSRFQTQLREMGDSWTELVAYAGGQPTRLVSELPGGVRALLEIALACAVPARLAILDGQLDWVDAEGQEIAARWLSLVSARQERFVVLTAREERHGFPAFQATVRLSGQLPVTASSD